MSTRYGLYCRDCQVETEHATYLAEGLRGVIAVFGEIAVIRSLAPDIEITVTGWQESEEILWAFLTKHGGFCRVIVIDEYGYPVGEPHMPHERLPIREDA